MNDGRKKAEHAIMRWAEAHPDVKTAPPYIANLIDIVNRYDQIESLETAPLRLDTYQLAEIKTDLDQTMPDYAARREAEQELAIYIDQVAGTQLQPDLYDLAQSLHDCRQSGAVGIKPDGGTVIAWDTKCGQVRLCPDESREETQRLIEWYLPPIMDWAKEKDSIPRRVYYAVFTDHNYRPGQLKAGKKYLFEKFKTWREEMKKAGLDIQGSLVVQEDPLSVHGDWNIHLNIFLLVRGRFDYDKARGLWGANLHFQQIDATDPAKLRGGLMEAIKYAAQIVPTKAQEHADSGKSEAPAMTQWPHDLWLEWWKAGQGFRRVRSYGCLYGLHEKQWNAATDRRQQELCEMADISTIGVVGEPWRALDEATRAKLRKVMKHGQPLDMTLIEWIGSVQMLPDGSYSVDLIPGDNFSGGYRGRNNFSNSDWKGGG